MNPLLIFKLLSRIPKAVIPNNERNKKESKKEKKYLFVSTTYHEVVDPKTGESKVFLKTHTYRNPDRKARKERRK